MKENLAAIVGPTGVGKSRLAVKVAKQVNGEIISCDSMQIYRGLNIGTAKITPDEMEGIPHHMIDIVEPDQSFSVADYQRMVRSLITSINERGKIPILVGGTGLYYQVVVDDYDLSPAITNPEIRKSLEIEAEKLGNEELHRRLQERDPHTAGRISINDRKRIIRALEVIAITGRPFFEFQRKNTNRYTLRAVGLTVSRQKMYKMLEDRVDKMIEKGLVQEVFTLMQRGYGLQLNSMQAIGYSHLLYYLEGYLNWEETIYSFKRDTKRYAKRQLTWFKKDPRIKWLDLTEYKEEKGLVEKISNYIRRTMPGNVE